MTFNNDKHFRFFNHLQRLLVDNGCPDRLIYDIADLVSEINFDDFASESDSDQSGVDLIDSDQITILDDCSFFGGGD